MRCKGAGFFGVIEREHVANYSFSTILYEPQKKLSEKHILEEIYYVLDQFTIFFVRFYKKVGIVLGSIF